MIHFASPPYTSEQAREKVLQLARELVPWCGRLNVTIVPFAEIQEEIRRNCPEDHFTLIMRRFMMRLADALARDLNCRALVTGESLGQVATWPRLSPVTRARQFRSRARASARRIINRRMIRVKWSSGQLRRISSWISAKGTMVTFSRPHQGTSSRAS